MRIKFLSLFSYLVIVIVSNHSCVSSSKIECDRINYNDDNNKNDTNRVIIEKRIIFDTTANLLTGVIVNSDSDFPISDANVYVTQGSKIFSRSSDAFGRFSFFMNNFSGFWQLRIVSTDFKCLIIDNIRVGGGLEIKIKLKKIVP